MKNYFKIMLDPKNRIPYAEECRKGNFIGFDFGINTNLTDYFDGDKLDFHKKLIPVYIANNPGKYKVNAGLASEILWTIFKEINIGDIVVCPNGRGVLYFGEITSEYFYEPNSIMPHRRTVNWLSATFKRREVSEDMKHSLRNESTSVMITQHADEIEKYIAANTGSVIISPDGTIEDLSVFALEKHLEDFLIENWKQTELGNRYDIYEQDGELVGQQFPTDTGPIDILAISKDKKELLVVELKKGRASDSVVGQIQRYMGYVKAELAEQNQVVKGVIIALDDDTKIKRALTIAKDIEFYSYQVTFKLFKP